MNTRLIHRSTPTGRSTAVVAIALAALLGLSACGGNDTTSTAGASGNSSTSVSPSIAADAAYNAQDVTFAKDMKPHHEQAVEMADLILAKNPSAPIKALADKIKAAQQPEITQLDSMLATFGVEAESSMGQGGGHDMTGSASGDMRMMSDTDMQALEDVTGAEAERLFLAGMLKHHKGAVEMATAEIDGGKYPQAIELATSIKIDQQGEITEMEQLVANA